MQNIVYHGSNVEVPVPRVLQNGFYKDFGYGFYCTNLFKQAKRWAMTKKENSVINRYKYVQDFIEGPMADDQIWNYVEAFIDGRIPRKAFWEIAKFNYPTHQIVFCTEEALKTLTFEGSDTL